MTDWLTDWLTDGTADVDNRKNVLQVEKYDINIMDDAVESFLQSLENIEVLYYFKWPSILSKEADHHHYINIQGKEGQVFPQSDRLDLILWQLWKYSRLASMSS